MLKQNIKFEKPVYAHIAEVSLPVPLSRLFSYATKEPLKPGVRVRVPFGPQTLLGVVIRSQEDTEESARLREYKLKPIKEVLDEAPIYSAHLLELAQWLSRYYLHPLGEVLKAMLPASREKATLVHVEMTPLGLVSASSELIEFLREPLDLESARAGLKALNLKLNSLIKEGLLAKKSRKVSRGRFSRSQKKAEEGSPEVAKATKPLALTQEQSVALRAVVDLMGPGPYRAKPILLQGVTGSGKTEVYLQAMQALFDQDKSAQALLMVPEISLTPQMTHIFESRFPGLVAVVHSGLLDRDRWAQILRIYEGSARILIGPRSAIFAPFQKLRLILIDEEHDSSYKQSGGFSYHGRDTAIYRAHLENALVVLGSATPSLETYQNALSGRYHHLRLTQRAQTTQLPEVSVIPHQASIAPEVLKALRSTYARGEQAIVVVGRRGYSLYLLNRTSGEAVRCPNCSISLTLHKRMLELRCHYCDYRTMTKDIVDQAPKDSYVAVGQGSQKIEETLQAALPEACVMRLDSDISSDRSELESILKRFRAGEIHVLVGTQILAKGHDFPKVTLVVILEIDEALNLPDFRAGERTFQTLTQAAGRAGRTGLHSRVLLQTLRSDNPVVQASLKHDFLSFAEKELAVRKVFCFPPFARLIHFVLSGPEEDMLDQFCAELGEWIRSHLVTRVGANPSGLRVLGPHIAAIEKIKGLYRRSLLLSGTDPKLLHSFAQNTWDEIHRRATGTKLGYSVDVDPQNLL